MVTVARDSAVWFMRWRAFKNRAVSALVRLGAVFVLLTLLMIFLFLFREALLLFRGVTITELESGSRWTAAESEIVSLSTLDNRDELQLLTLDGRLVRQTLGHTPQSPTIAATLPEDTGLFQGGTGSQLLAWADPRYGRVTLLNQSLLPDSIQFAPETLKGAESYRFGDGRFLQLAFHRGDEITTLAGITEERRLLYQHFTRGTENRSGRAADLGPVENSLALILLDQGRWLVHISTGGRYQVWGLDRFGDRQVIDAGMLIAGGGRVAAVSQLSGGGSLIVASALGELTRWHMVNTAGGNQLMLTQRFDSRGEVALGILPEPRHRGFVVFTESGQLQVYHSLNRQPLEQRAFSLVEPDNWVFSPEGNKLLVLQSGGDWRLFKFDNPHPEVTFDTLWSRIWYEGYPDAEFIWQSSSADDDYQPKLSLVPLAVGTLKAALVAMLLAVPLAIGSAIYTAQFMATPLRRVVKPAVEMMEALPTVILGFVAGLWLAPYIEQNLAALLVFLGLLVPVSLLLAAAWYLIPASIRGFVPSGWHLLLLLPMLGVLLWLCFSTSPQLEWLLFGGDARAWIGDVFGVSYQQRNALVVGFVMGMAVMPTIFTIAEDAIFSVPRHLTDGSLALSATPWQTLTQVTLPSASPGVFSAIMIGLGKALGETMIVLIASGNTPISEVNLFEGMRTLAANIAIEAPEAEVGSSLYRVLFLSALLLFVFTFVINTIAEWTRQNLRSKYARL